MTDTPLGPLVCDVQAMTLSPEERDCLRDPRVGGVILFSRNFESRKQVAQLTASIRALRNPALLICVDHEGGRVQRFRRGFTPIPPMASLGAQWQQDPLAACRQATHWGRVIGQELRAVGIDLSFTPVLDLDHGRSQVIGDRALHHDPRTVAMLARCLSHGLLLAGMGNCGKHFPGHGYAQADSHHAEAIDSRSLEEILATDAAPYGWLGETLLSVMPAHVVYPQVDARPAGFSSLWLKRILRQQLGFDGLIFSDDLMMQAAGVAGDVVARAQAALRAGCDMVLVCNRPEAVQTLLARWTPRPNRHLARRLQALRSPFTGLPRIGV